ncbi:hypothetical protein ABZW11_24300 [Nonomuraea sp. NPDC004580]|uniref:hypothetical protein n=1 Tax=Nonomuraea sp. NPDC004580 TaxID=3154552 RepID=UPI0033B705F0
MPDFGAGVERSLFIVASCHRVRRGVRLEPAMTPLFQKLINIARTHSPASVLCFNTGPQTTVDAVRRWWPRPSDAG